MCELLCVLRILMGLMSHWAPTLMSIMVHMAALGMLWSVSSPADVRGLWNLSMDFLVLISGALTSDRWFLVRCTWRSSGTSCASSPRQSGAEVQRSLDCYLYLPIIYRCFKHCPSVRFFCLTGYFFWVWRISAYVTNYLLSSLGPWKTRNSHCTDLKSQRSQFDNLCLLPTLDANQVFPAWKAHCHIRPSFKLP